MSVEGVLAEVKDLQGAARSDELVKLAEAEGGELSLYTTMSIDLSAALTEAFAAQYALGISVVKGGDTIVQRIVEEGKAGFRGADVAAMGGQHLIELSHAGALQPYRSPSAASLVAGSAHQDWTAARRNVFVVARNSKLVPANEAPLEWEDLGNPRSKGRLIMNSDDPEWFATLWDSWVVSGKTPAEAERLMEAIGRNATFVGSHSLARRLLAAGEFDLAVSYRHTIDNDKEGGAPLAWQPSVEPLIWKPDAVGIVAEPPNPAAAVLFIDWVLGEGQQVFAEAKSDPLREDLLEASSLRQIPLDVESFDADRDEWLERHEQFVRLGAKGPEG